MVLEVNKPEPEEAIYDLPEHHSHLHLGKHQVVAVQNAVLPVRRYILKILTGD